MKVLMAGPWFSVHTKRPLRWLLEEGCSVTCVAGENPLPEGHPGYKWRQFPHPRGRRLYDRFGHRVSSRLAKQTVLWQLRQMQRALQPDVVHVHWVDVTAYRFAEAGLSPLVLSVWGSDINQHFQPDADPGERGRCGLALRRADLVIVDSPDMPEKCNELAGKEVPCRLLHLGVDPELFRPGLNGARTEWRDRLGVPEAAKVLLSIRAWGEHNQHHLILDAFARALPKMRHDTRLVFKVYNRISCDDPDGYTGRLQRQAEELGVAEHVVWLDEVAVEDLPGVYAASDIIVNYPSIDAFPVTFLEAAACEKPVVSNLLPAYQETFAEDHFRMVSPEDLDGLAEAIAAEVNAAPDTQRLREARETVEADYSEQSYIKGLLDIYQELSGQ